MRTKTVHHVLVDSRDRDKGLYPAPNAYRVTLPKLYRNVVSARLLSLSLPTTFYVFSTAQRNTTLQVSVQGSAYTDLTIADGNYSVDTLATTLKAKIEDAFPANTFEVWCDASTLQFNITCLEGGVVSVVVPSTSEGPVDTSLAYLLGFRGTEVSSGGTLTSSSVMNTNPWTYVVLDVAELLTIDEGGLNGNPIGKGCFAHVALPAKTFEHVFLNAANSMYPAVPQCPAIPKLARLTILFRTHDGTVVNFHGVDHSFLLELVTHDPGASSSCYGPPTETPVQHVTHTVAPPSPAAQPAVLPVMPPAAVETPGGGGVPWKPALAVTAAGLGMWYWSRQSA